MGDKSTWFKYSLNTRPPCSPFLQRPRVAYLVGVIGEVSNPDDAIRDQWNVSAQGQSVASCGVEETIGMPAPQVLCLRDQLFENDLPAWSIIPEQPNWCFFAFEIGEFMRTMDVVVYSDIRTSFTFAAMFGGFSLLEPISATLIEFYNFTLPNRTINSITSKHAWPIWKFGPYQKLPVMKITNGTWQGVHVDWAKLPLCRHCPLHFV